MNGRFKGERIALSGKFAKLRKDEVVEVLEAEGATVADKLGKDTSLFVYAVAGSTDHKKAEKMRDGGAKLVVVSEDEFRRRRLLPTADEAIEMLSEKSGRTRLANLLELNRARYMRTTDEYSTVRLEKRDLRKAKLSNVSLCGLHFIECDLREADLTKAKWLAQAKKSDFRKASAKGVELVEAKDCDFRDADLVAASLRDMQRCNFDGADLTKGHALGDLSECRFEGAMLDGFHAAHGKLRKCSFANASLKNAKLEEVEIADSSFAGASFHGATLKGDSDPLVFEDCDFRKADFREASLSHVQFKGCDVTGARFDGAKLTSVEGLGATSGPKEPAKGPAHEALVAAAPTFKNVTVNVMLKVGKKKVECVLYQFDHSANTSCRQAWLDGDNVGALTLAEAITTIAKLNPGAQIDDLTLKVKATKGKKAPSLMPKEFERAILAAWQEALRA